MRAAYWRHVVSTILPSLAVDYLGNQPPHARLESRSFADARVIRFIDDTHGCHVTHTPSGPNAYDSYLLVQQFAGSGRYRHRGREIELDSGDLLLLDKNQQFELSFPKAHHELVWELPRTALAPLLAAPERATVRISGHQGFGALLAVSMQMLADQAGSHDATSQRSLRLHLCNLAALAVGAALPAHETRHETYRTARRQQILAYVEAHLREDSLSAEKAARELKMSRRWLHELFSERATTFAAWIARRRVEECRKLLEDPEYDRLSVSEIAFRAGFNDLSTFNRQFRAQFRMSPREVRRSRLSMRE